MYMYSKSNSLNRLLCKILMEKLYPDRYSSARTNRFLPIKLFHGIKLITYPNSQLFNHIRIYTITFPNQSHIRIPSYSATIILIQQFWDSGLSNIFAKRKIRMIKRYTCTCVWHIIYACTDIRASIAYIFFHIHVLEQYE